MINPTPNFHTQETGVSKTRVFLNRDVTFVRASTFVREKIHKVFQLPSTAAVQKPSRWNQIFSICSDLKNHFQLTAPNLSETVTSIRYTRNVETTSWCTKSSQTQATPCTSLKLQRKITTQSYFLCTLILIAVTKKNWRPKKKNHYVLYYS